MGNTNPTFSFGEPKKYDKYLELGNSGIKVLANEDPCDQDQSTFKLRIFELANDFAADFQSDTKCIDSKSVFDLIK